ncbi:hypothetical protein EMIT0P100_70234 [Pseudomonas sp. IT-P100]
MGVTVMTKVGALQALEALTGYYFCYQWFRRTCRNPIDQAHNLLPFQQLKNGTSHAPLPSHHPQRRLADPQHLQGRRLVQ